jgi:hypothetical protein
MCLDALRNLVLVPFAHSAVDAVTAAIQKFRSKNIPEVGV